VPIREKNKMEDYLYVRDVSGLVALVQMGVLEIHLWGSKVKTVEQPDRLIFDLDPDPAVAWPEVIAAAKRVRSLLQENHGLESVVKTTGGKGLHVVAPIRPRADWDEVKAFCQSVADQLVAEAPTKYIATMSKAARRGKIFIDYLRNARGATSIAPYSTRSREGAPVSVPLRWEELTARIKPNQFTVENLNRRLKKLDSDPWAELLTGEFAKQPLPKRKSTGRR
jgi:bifunctional non-homologous end joining protein LigD